MNQEPFCFNPRCELHKYLAHPSDTCWRVIVPHEIPIITGPDPEMVELDVRTIQRRLYEHRGMVVKFCDDCRGKYVSPRRVPVESSPKHTLDGMIRRDRAMPPLPNQKPLSK